MLWKNPRPRKRSGSGEGQGSDPAHASELLIAGSSPGCPVVCIPGADFQAGLPWCLSLAALHQSGCSAFHPVPPVKLGLHSCLSHPPQGKAAHSFPQHPSGADLPRNSKWAPKKWDLHLWRQTDKEESLDIWGESLAQEWPQVNPMSQWPQGGGNIHKKEDFKKNSHWYSHKDFKDCCIHKTKTWLSNFKTQ